MSDAAASAAPAATSATKVALFGAARPRIDTHPEPAARRIHR